MKFDVSRIRDLFVPEVGSSGRDCDLLALIRRGFQHLTREDSGENSSCWIHYAFGDITTVNFHVGFLRRLPHLWGLNFRGAVKDIFDIPSAMWGAFEAHFEALKAEEILAPVGTDSLARREGNVAELDLLRVHFCGDPSQQGVIKKITTPIVKDTLGTERSYFEFSVLKMLLKQAESVTVRDSFHLGDDERSDLVHETATLYADNGSHILQYEAHAAAELVISIGPCVDHFQRIFDSLDLAPTEDELGNIQISYE